MQPHRILQALRRYVRAENKDRLHTIRHYQHVLAVDPEKAAQMKSQVQLDRVEIAVGASLVGRLLWSVVGGADSKNPFSVLLLGYFYLKEFLEV